MTATGGPDKRVMLPRWRPWRDSERAGELHGLNIEEGVLDQTVADDVAEEQILKRIRDYDRWHGLHEATDLIGTALVLGRVAHERVQEVANELSDSPYPVARDLAKAVLSGPQLDSDENLEPPTANRQLAQLRVRKLKEIVRREPRNTLAWADLALAQTVLGNADAADIPMRISLAQAAGNRFVLRAAARFYVHKDELDRAQRVLTSDADHLASDPWLLSAEIAIADLMKQSSRFIRKAKMLLNADFAPRNLSELASALSTIELKAGRTKEARKLLSMALVDPTENALAQAEWSVDRGIDVVDPRHLNLRRGFEARARRHARSKEFEPAVKEGALWLADQPFAIDPALYTSYMASTFTNDFGAAIEACKIGLITNPRNSGLLNNLAFALANAGQVTEAHEVLARPMDTLSKSDQGILTATRGLIAFRDGDLALGRELYRKAISQLRSDNVQNAALAFMFWAYEEEIAGCDPNKVLTDAERLGSSVLKNPDVVLVRTRLGRLK